ncbi:MAG: thioesterase [Lactobacillus sp.]|nr:thioesterase [Lactobacillus sp.]
MTLESPLVYEARHRLSYYECDATGHPSLSMLISMAVQVSEEHGNLLGLDTAVVQSYGGGWVITSYEGSFAKQQPVNGEEIILGTRAIANNRFFALREFWIQSADHKIEYAHLTGLFVYMNLKTRHLMSIPSAIIEPYHGPEKKRLPRLAKACELKDVKFKNDYHVRFFDIDSNRHVNNARYFDWMQDPLGAEFLSSHRLKHMTMSYEKEVRYGQTITSEISSPYYNENGELATDHRIVFDSQLAAASTMIWHE